MMNSILLSDYLPALPELWMMVMILVTLLVSLFVDKVSSITSNLSQLTLLGAALCTAYSFMHSSLELGHAVLIFHDQFVLDELAVILKLLVYLVVWVVFLYSRQYNKDRNIPDEFYILGLISTLGMMVLISGHNLLTIYMGIELFSLPIYAMVALERRQGRCIEAAMKYFIIGALASGILLYGLSFIFGMTDSLDIAEIAKHVSLLQGGSLTLLVIALIFVLVGIAFKLGAAPFHMWVPDVYEGASTSVTLFVSTAPKLAAFALAIRLVMESLPTLSLASQHVFIVIAVLSIAIGNLAALLQTSLKRMFAYSSIAHIGYMLLGLAAMTPDGAAAALFYVITYVISTLVSFGLLTLLSRAGFEADEIEDFAGLSARNPWLAFLMMIVMFSMAGIPPFVGFIAKVGVLEALVHAQLIWLAVVALVFAIIGSYYYLRVVKAMYFDDPSVRMPLPCAIDNKIIMTFNGLAVVVLGIFPGSLFTLCHLIFQP